MQIFQATLKQEIAFNGHGVHSGKPSTVVIKPAEANHGIVFVRHFDGKEYRFSALSQNTGKTNLFTSLGKGEARVEMIEHLMAAIAAFGLDNLEIEVSSNEIPILDGSSYDFVKAFAAADIVFQQAPKKYFVIKKPVRVEKGDDYVEFLPHDGCRFDVAISFSSKIIGSQELSLDLNRANFVNEISRARTFGFMKDAKSLWDIGMALGSSLENSIVIGDNDEILNTGGLHYSNEFVRHKMLDAIGDTALLGAPFRGIFRSYRGGHGLNAQLLKTFFEQKENYVLEDFSEKN